jgi:L-lactate dehydrogenase complex protein LldF
MALVARVFASRRLYELAQQIGRRVQWPLTRRGRIRRLPPPLSGWTTSRDLDPVAAESFRDWWQRGHKR